MTLAFFLNAWMIVAADISRGPLRFGQLFKNLGFLFSKRFSDWREMLSQVCIVILSSQSLSPIARKPVMAIAVVWLTHLA